MHALFVPFVRFGVICLLGGLSVLSYVIYRVVKDWELR